MQVETQASTCSNSEAAPPAAGTAAAGLGLPTPLRNPTRRPWPAGRATRLSLRTVEGSTWRLADFAGQALLLNFWASWCEPCRSELPSLELAAQRHEADGLVVVAINHRETDAALRRFLETMPISVPVLRDGDGAAAQAFGVRIFPTTIAIGRNGRVAFVVVGEATGPGLRSAPGCSSC
jgi:thiol-disulfide isomerase/thioredoxin